MQHEAIHAIYQLEDRVLRSGDADIIADWRKLQTSDHFYYMCTKWFKDGDVHAYFSPYETPYEAFTNFMNAWHDMSYRLTEKGFI
jgi:alpha-amylase